EIVIASAAGADEPAAVHKKTFHIGRNLEVDRGNHHIDVDPRIFVDGIAGIVHDVNIIPQPAGKLVGPAAAVEYVVAVRSRQGVVNARSGQDRVGNALDLVGGQVVQACDRDLEVGLVVGSHITYQEGEAAVAVVFQLALADGQIGRAESKEGEVLVT